MKKLTEKFNRAFVDQGDTFEVELPYTSGDGCAWEVKVVSGKAKLSGNTFPLAARPAGNKKKSGHEEQLNQRFFFVAKECGEVEIKAEYKNPKVKEAAKTHSFKISVLPSLD